jgi:hypothetical protein
MIRVIAIVILFAVAAGILLTVDNNQYNPGVTGIHLFVMSGYTLLFGLAGGAVISGVCILIICVSPLLRFPVHPRTPEEEAQLHEDLYGKRRARHGQIETAEQRDARLKQATW